VLFLLLGLLLFAIFRGLHHLISLLRITRSRRQQILRLLPVGETFVALLYLLTAIPMVFKDHPHYSPIVLTVLIAGIIWVSWFAIRDFVSGLFLRAGGFCQQGDWIRSSEIQGTVVRLGYRVLELEARNGETVYVPYSRISRQALARVPAMKGLARHQFELVTPSERAAPELSALIRNTILNHHWTSLIQAPRIERLDGGRYELTVFALDVAYAPAIERSVREAIQETEVLDEDITASA
jgi:small-conductance mechanosensitive channel